MAKKLQEPDGDQLLLDMEEVRERLTALKKLMKKQEELDAEIRELDGKLKQLKRKRKEVGWNLRSLLTAERKRPLPEVWVEDASGKVVDE